MGGGQRFDDDSTKALLVKTFGVGDSKIVQNSVTSFMDAFLQVKKFGSICSSLIEGEHWIYRFTLLCKTELFYPPVFYLIGLYKRLRDCLLKDQEFQTSGRRMREK